MLPATRAPVRPRVLLPESTTALPLEDEVRSLLERRRGGLVQVLGGPGSGKTTALRHLAAVLAPDDSVVLLDGAPAAGFETPDHTLTVYAGEERLEGRATLAVYRLAPWSEDEWIEYLLARHPHRCASVIGRLRAAADVASVPRVPELWTAVLDRLAADEGIRSAREALEAVLRYELPNQAVRLAVRAVCLDCVHRRGSPSVPEVAELRRHGCSARLLSLSRHEVVRLLVAAEQVVADLLS
jgi:energy-coupling factor transporter ATP-binding protein EcfA2